jgi:hypothetical protein
MEKQEEYVTDLRKATLAEGLKQNIHHCDPYEGFDWEAYPDDLTGGEIYPIWEQIDQGIQPQLAIEVGSWKGKSAIHLAGLMRQRWGANCAVVCVDTWLGSDPVHQWRFRNDTNWGMGNRYHHGYPTMYFQFLANVCRQGFQDIIVPFPNTSNVAAVWFAQAGLQADLIYIDACHDEDEVYLDLCHYWPLLRPGGVMFGDDFDVGWYGVICAVNRFVREEGLQLMITEGNKWVIQKEK